jgi:methylenetetrahydrofolate reductase (NADPH)
LTRIAELYRAHNPVFSFEFFPPRTPQAAETLERTIAELNPLDPGFVSVTYGAGGSTRELTVDLVSRIRAEVGLEAMAHLTCGGHTAEELAEVLDRLEASGVENVIALRGDPPRGETAFRPVPGGFRYGSELAAFIRSRWSFCLAGACYPEKHLEAPSFEEDLAHAKEKVEAGVEVLITQLFFEPEVYFRFVERARAVGIGVPIVPGVMPVSNLGQIRRFTQMCGASIPQALAERLEAAPAEDDVVDVGIEWATEQCRRLLDGGAPGVHFYTLNRSRSTVAIVRRLRAA